MRKFQSDELTEDECILIGDALRAAAEKESTSDTPDNDKVEKLHELAEHFGDPTGNMVDLGDDDEDEGEEADEPAAE